jgi:hypothetical protein
MAMEVKSYIVECGLCQQPWEVPRFLMSTPRHAILIPEHRMLDSKTNERNQQSCSGAEWPGLGLGSRGAWERRWPLRGFIGRPQPAVLNGSAIRVS